MNRNQPNPHNAAAPSPDSATDQLSIPTAPTEPAHPALLAEPTEPADRVDLAALFAEIQARVSEELAFVEWAEAEIATASRRHRAQADLLHHVFGLLTPRHIGPGMGTEFVFRGHVRELLARVVAGADLRPATAAEVCLTLSQVSKVVPMHGAGAGLYFRMWLAAFPDHPVYPDQAANQVHYEQLYGPQMDELEATVRSKVADPDRQLGDIHCDGLHHSKSVVCRFIGSGRPTP